MCDLFQNSFHRCRFAFQVRASVDLSRNEAASPAHFVWSLPLSALKATIILCDFDGSVFAVHAAPFHVCHSMALPSEDGIRPLSDIIAPPNTLFFVGSHILEGEMSCLASSSVSCEGYSELS